MDNKLQYDEMEFLIQKWIEHGIEEFNLSGVIVVCQTKGEGPNYVVSKGTCKHTEELLKIQKEEVAKALAKLMDKMIMEHRKGMTNKDLFKSIGKILGGSK